MLPNSARERACACCRACSTRAQRETCEAYLGMEVVGKVGLILTADPGDFSGTSEAFHILANLQDKQVKAAPHRP